MFEFCDIPQFLLERGIAALESFRDELDAEIRRMRQELEARDWKQKRRQHMRRFTKDLIEKGVTDEGQAIQELMLQGNGRTPKHCREVLESLKTRLKRQKKAATELEIYRRWFVGKEKKTALAREFGLSRATVERICRKLSEDGKGLSEIEKGYWSRVHKHRAKQRVAKLDRLEAKEKRGLDSSSPLPQEDLRQEDLTAALAALPAGGTQSLAAAPTGLS